MKINEEFTCELFKFVEESCDLIIGFARSAKLLFNSASTRFNKWKNSPYELIANDWFEKRNNSNPIIIYKVVDGKDSTWNVNELIHKDQAITDVSEISKYACEIHFARLNNNEIEYTDLAQILSDMDN